MIGSNSSDTRISLFAFLKDILGYDLADFFQKNSAKIKVEIDAVLKTLLNAN
jgi:hypothetical protein